MLRTWRGEVRRHRVHGVGEILPRARDARHDGLAAELAFGADLARHARHFGCERAQLVHHRVDGFLELQNFAAHVHRDLARQVAARDGGGHLGDVAHLAGEVAGHRVHVVGEIFPRARGARHHGLAAELAFGADLARHARHFGSERAHLLDHRVHDGGGAQELALQRAAIHFEAMVCDRSPFATAAIVRVTSVVGHSRSSMSVLTEPSIAPQAPERRSHGHAMARLAVLADDLAGALELARHALVRGDDLVERVGDLAVEARLVARQAHGEIAVAHGLQRAQQLAHVEVDVC